MMKISKPLLLGALTVGTVFLGTNSSVAHASLTPSSSQPRTDMVDLSSWQANLSSSDYQTMADAGVKAVAIKASEGTTYTNEILTKQVQYAQNAGLAVNYYHFARFTTTAEAQAEAQTFIRAVQSVTDAKNMVMVVDFEASNFQNLSKATNNQNLAAFDETLAAAGYQKTDLYTMASWIGRYIDTNASNKGWLAQWPSNPSGDAYPTANAWQWASDYRFSGESQDLDVSQLNNDFYLNGASTTTSTPSSNASTSSTSSQTSDSDAGSTETPTTTIVKVPTTTSTYSKARSDSVKLIWRAKMGRHAYHTTSGARYSKHLGTRYASMSNLPNTTWYTNYHEKLYNKKKGTSAIYYHIVSGNGKHAGWIWRGYLHAGVNPNA